MKSTLLQFQMLKILDQNDDILRNDNDFVVPDTICAKAAYLTLLMHYGSLF